MDLVIYKRCLQLLWDEAPGCKTASSDFPDTGNTVTDVIERGHSFHSFIHIFNSLVI